MRSHRHLIPALLFGSGMTSLIYQTAWQRLFRLVFGASTAASAAVLGIFLGGLGLGAFVFGNRSEQSERPLMFYGNLEIGVALCAALSPLLIELGSKSYLALGGSAVLGGAGATSLRLLIAALAIGPSVVLMGGTLPAAARAIENEGDAARGRLALIYATNTLGAVLGALLATFLLFELLGTRLSLWGAVLVNLLVAMLARSIGRSAERVTPDVGESGGPPVSLPEPSLAPAAGVARLDSDGAATPSWLVYAAAGIVGFTFLCSELVWYRMLAPILGGSSFTFGLILAVALFGIGAGAWVYARSAEARAASIGSFVLTIFLEALTLGAPLVLGDDIAVYAANTRGLGSLGFGVLVFSWAVIASAVVLPAALVSGYQLPVIFALLGRGRRQVARHVGVAYAFNTSGAIAGALLGGFVLIPWLGAVGTWRLLVGLLVGLGAAVMGYGLLRDPAFRRWSTAGSGLFGLAAAGSMLASGPSGLWRHGSVGAGRSTIQHGDVNGLMASQRDLRRDLIWERDGVESAVAMTSSNGIGFVVNGKVDGSVVTDRGTQAALGLLPVVLHPAAKTVFVLGLGTGMSAGWVSVVPGVQRVDVAELEPAIVEVARAAASVNRRVLEQPNVHLFEGDGREWLLTTRRRYDLIVSEPSNPYRAGVASLFTREFYAAVEQRLEPAGIFAQWVQGYEIDAETLRIVLRTLREAFPVIEIWHTQPDDLLLIATRQPLVHDIAELRRRLAMEPFLSALPRMLLVEGAEGLLSHFLANDAASRNIADAFGSPINTDDATVLEYAFARHLGALSDGFSAQFFQLGTNSAYGRPQTVGSLDWGLARELRGRAWLIAGGNIPQLPTPPDASRRARAVALGCRQRFAEALDAWQLSPANTPQRPRASADVAANAAPLASEPLAPAPAAIEPRDIIEVFVVGNGYAHHGDERSLPLASRLAARGFEAEARLTHARFEAARDRPERAAAELIAGLEALRAGSIGLCETAAETVGMLPRLVRGRLALARQALAAIMAGPLAAYQGEAVRARAAQNIAFELDDPELCVAALGADLQAPLWNRWLLENRVDCLRRAAHPLLDTAEADLRRFIGNTPGRLADGVAPNDEVMLESRRVP